jgi:hypothetical protein
LRVANLGIVGVGDVFDVLDVVSVSSGAVQRHERSHGALVVTVIVVELCARTQSRTHYTHQ